MIASQDDVSGDALDCDLRREEARRLARGSLVAALPSEFTLDPEQEAHWRTQWTRATRGAPISFDEAFALAALFLGPLLLGDVRGTRWSAATQAWVASSSPAAADHVGRPSRDTRRP
jgi:hypothetical protein